MNDATVRFGYDGLALNAGLADSEQRIKRFGATAESQFRRTTAASEQMGRAMNKKPGMWNLGNVSMQLQDVAVQMQSGTKASVIFAQQGSQLLSAFGPMGMIAGLAAAVGGALYSAKQAGDEAFKALQTESENFGKSLRIMSVGSITDMINGMETMSMRAEALKTDVKNMSEPGMWNRVANIFSKSTFDPNTNKWTTKREEEIALKQEVARKNEQGRLKLIDQIIKASDDELEIQRLKAEGKSEEVAMLEDQIALQRDLAKLEDAPDAVKAKLTENAKLTMELRQQTRELEKQKQLEEVQKKQAQNRETISNMREELGILELQASGRDRLVKKAERELQQRRRMKELIATGMDPRSAEDYVRRETSARDAIEKRRANGGRGPIGGVREKRFMESGIDQFRRNQLKMETSISDPSLPGYRRGQSVPQFNAFGIEPTSFQLRGRMMGGMTQPLTERAARVPGAPDLSRAVQASRPADVGSKIDHTNAILTRAFL